MWAASPLLPVSVPVAVDGPVEGVAELDLLGKLALASNATVEPDGEGGTRIVGDATETAIMRLLMEGGQTREEIERERPRVGEVPFSSARKMMTSVHALPQGGYLVLTKGAFDRLPFSPAPAEELRRRPGGPRRVCRGRAARHRAGQPRGGRASRQRKPGGARARPHLRGHHRPHRPTAPRGGGRHRDGPPRRHPHGHDHRRPRRHGRGHRAADRHSRREGRGGHGQAAGRHDGRGARDQRTRLLRVRARLSRGQDPHRGGLAGAGRGREHDRATASTTLRRSRPPMWALPWARPAPRLPRRPPTWC